MTKLESAEIIIRQNGDCTGIHCDKCLLDNYCDVRTKDEDKLGQAKKYKEEYKMELIKGKRYEVSNNEDFLNSKERIFDSYDEGFQEPYRCIDCMFEDEYENKFCIETDTWKYLREIQSKYEPYTEPKLEWIDKDIVHKRNKNMACYIDSITRDSCDENVFAIRTDWGTEYTCKQLFKDWNWADGSIIGKEIK